MTRIPGKSSSPCADAGTPPAGMTPSAGTTPAATANPAAETPSTGTP